MYKKFILGLLVLGFGILGIVFPIKTAVSKTIPYVEPSGLYMEQDNGVANQLYDEWLAKKAKKGSSYCSCVLFVKSVIDYTNSVGAARNWPKNTNAPIVGGVVITNESYAGHVAYITAVYNTYFHVVEGNYYSCKKSERDIQLNDPVILGFWEPR